MKPIINGNVKLNVVGKKVVKFTLKKELKTTSRMLIKIKKNPV